MSQDPVPRESSVVVSRDGVSVRVRCALIEPRLYAGGPVAVEFSVTNAASVPLFYLVGDAGGRPAYLEFQGELRPSGLKLRDPYPQTPIEPEGPIATLPVAPGATDARTIVLNQYLTLEDTRQAISPGTSAELHLRWRCHLAVARNVESDLPVPEPVEGELQATLTRDDEALGRTIASHADRLLNDAAVLSRDPIGRQHAAVVLGSLRLRDVIPYLRKLVDHADFSVRRMAEQALRELEHEPEK